MKNKKIIIDFDSTFVKSEGLPELAEISLRGRDDKEEIKNQIDEITEAGMNGTLSFKDSLLKRIALLHAKKEHVLELAEKMKNDVSLSFKENKKFLRDNADNILIFSGGFKEFIKPVLLQFGIKEESIYANTFVYDEEGNVIGFDEDNFLSQAGGKVKQLRELEIKEDVFVVGDGYTDYEMKEAGLAQKFYAFTENARRETVVKKADMTVSGFSEVIADLV